MNFGRYFVCIVFAVVVMLNVMHFRVQSVAAKAHASAHISSTYDSRFTGVIGIKSGHSTSQANTKVT
jgi:hypothetical protein